MKQDRKKILLLGHGEMGHAMQYLLEKNHDLAIWQRRPAAGTKAADLEALVPGQDIILFCLPAPPHAAMVDRLLPILSAHTVCLSIAKGLDDEGHTPAEVFRAKLAGRIRYGLLYGPMISEEIRAGKPAFALLSTDQDDTYRATADLFRGTGLHVEQGGDTTGASWSAVLKNVYAMLFGMADELGLGDNMRGYLAVAATREIGMIVAQRGGQATTPYLLAGLGDLITTATSSGSHHHELGRLLVRGRNDAMRGEGIHTLRTIRSLRVFDTASYPLYSLMQACVADPTGIRERFNSYLKDLD